jgi:hypothetical protein
MLAFDVATFKGLLTRMFTKELLPLSKIESPTIRDILTYLNPRYKAVIPSCTTLRASITATYNNALVAVVTELATVSTKISISFDL